MKRNRSDCSVSTSSITTNTSLDIEETLNSSNNNISSSIDSIEKPQIRVHNKNYHNFQQSEISAIQENLLAWYRENKRDLPWRDRTVENVPYRVLVAEFMSQQTRVATVIKYFEKWIAKWPTVKDLADATIEQVNEMWAGLGYYRRAQNLHNCAKKIVTDFNGIVPSKVEQLLTLPGVCILFDLNFKLNDICQIGPYTAGSISSTAFDERAAIVDGNVSRVVSRLRAIGTDPAKSSKLVWKLAEQLVPQQSPGDFNQGLMELGAVLCSIKSPSCTNCPVREQCLAFREVSHPDLQSSLHVNDDDVCALCETTDEHVPEVVYFPRKKLKTKQRKETTVCVIVESEDGRVILTRRPATGLLANMFEFPQMLVDNTSDNAALCETARTVFGNVLQATPSDLAASLSVLTGTELGRVQHIFSHIRLTMIVFHFRLLDSHNLPTTIKQPFKIVSIDEVCTNNAVTKGNLKCLELLEKKKKNKQKMNE